jgi:fructosamine-3-kinase
MPERLDRLTHAVSVALGTTVVSASRAPGGDINEAFDARLADGRRVFVKTNRRADPRMFACEAHGLEWLREADAVRIPAVLAYSNSDSDSDSYADNTTPFLALERIASTARAADFDDQLGRSLAQLHRFGAPAFGFTEANFIGSLPQDNTACATWAEFYVRRRLEPQLRAAIDAGHAASSRSRWTRDFDRLFARINDLTGPTEPPARLHGDLWGGNVLADENGAPCLIDPAVYGGHREVDLAMLRLFGGASPRCYAAYHEKFPLAEGHAERVRLYQLYPLLVHVNLFGGGYVSSVESALSAYL